LQPNPELVEIVARRIRSHRGTTRTLARRILADVEAFQDAETKREWAEALGRLPIADERTEEGRAKMPATALTDEEAAARYRDLCR
jgi:hypothetical protein